MTAILGYARVSTIGQDLHTQRAALGAAGVDPSRMFTDKLSGSAKTTRPGLAALLDYAYASINPAAVQRRIQALTSELITLTTSKAGPSRKAPVTATSSRASTNESTNQTSRAS